MIFSSRDQQEVKIFVNNMELNKVSVCKYLGVTLDEELKWREHIESVHKKLLSLLVYSINCKAN
jgi:hypothetical protein